jgi:hypothetical protein
MIHFLAIIIQTGHYIQDKLMDYWATMEQFHTPFYSNTIKQGRLLHILSSHTSETRARRIMIKVRMKFQKYDEYL